MMLDLCQHHFFKRCILSHLFNSFSVMVFMKNTVTIIGAGASGLFCASLLAEKGFNVIVIDNGKKIGRKIAMSGGGFCNFTNLNLDPNCYLSQNPHFCKSALKRFTQWDFIQLIDQAKIRYHEKERGQLFCDHSAQEIIDLLAKRCKDNHVQFRLKQEVNEVIKEGDEFILKTAQGEVKSAYLIVATGGLSMPKLGATSIGYKIASQFGIPIVPVRAGLVPFTLDPLLLDKLSPLSGIALPVLAQTGSAQFENQLLFTHRGLSGPAMLQLSNYWQVGTEITLSLCPHCDLIQFLQEKRQSSPNSFLKTALQFLLPNRAVEILIELFTLPNLPLKQLTQAQLLYIKTALTEWKIKPNGTEGYRTAEVTLGGVDTHFISSKTMAAKTEPHLFFIGEVLDVTGWLGGYNFQWAWSSAFACASEMILAQTKA